ncbi:MAG: type II secretion system inner membrane protein GspF [Betaproteobacteria bacterium]|nr:type II secretion system inner membrane protein GspF [Betaproteobacteria bacterium]
MPGYKYTAYDLDGREQRGVLESDSPRLARAQLRERGLFPLDVTLIEAANDANAVVSRRKRIRIGNADLARITRQLATLLGAGLTIEQTFNALIEQAETENERQLLARLRGAVLEGQSLGAALSAYPETFSDLYRTLISAGEASGKLPEVLLRLADYVEDRQALRNKFIVAMIYPAIVMLVCVLVVTGLMIYVVPQVVGVFETTKQTLPLITRILLGVSKFLQATGILWLALAVIGIFAGRAALKREAIRRRWHAQLLRLPVIGRLIRAQQSSQLAATLSILVGSGVPVLNALNAGVGVVGNLPMRDALERAANAVREGAGLSQSLAASRQFPPVMVHLIASGEASGRLPQTLAAAATQQQRDVDTRTSALAAIIEPVMIVVMGVVVLTIVLAVLLPIFEMNQLVR